MFKSSKKLAKEAGDEFYHTGKPCKNGHISLRRARDTSCVDCGKMYYTAKKQSTPQWAHDSDDIKTIYNARNRLARQWGLLLVVDHIIPIVSETVCGLNCWHNLQIITQDHNRTKGSTYQTDW